MSLNFIKLFQENDELRMKEKQQRQQIDLLEANEKELAKKNHSNQKVQREIVLYSIGAVKRCFFWGFYLLWMTNGLGELPLRGKFVIHHSRPLCICIIFL